MTLPSTQSMQRAAIVNNMAVSKRMVKAAPASYAGNPEYGLNDEDMAKAIKAALNAAVKEWK